MRQSVFVGSILAVATVGASIGTSPRHAPVRTPAFAVRVIVEPSAADKLEALGEALVARVMFEGTAHQFPNPFLGTMELELPASGGTAAIPRRTFGGIANERLTSVTINVVSTRKTQPANLLHCDAPTIPDRVRYNIAEATHRSWRELENTTVDIWCR